MRILICNARLEARAGSELATTEIAEAHRRAGHDVALFTLRPGDFGRRFAERTGIPVLTMGEGLALREFAPELIHVHHWPTIVTLESLGVVAPWVIGFLGRFPALENPPPLMPGAHVPWWTLNEVAEAHYCGIPGWGQSRHRVVGNWFDDHRLGRPEWLPAGSGGDGRMSPPGSISTVLVVSNHFPQALEAGLRRVAEERGMSVAHVGLPDRSTYVDGDLLQQFDAVVTIGRTAILAMAAGVPVLLADHMGADGWVRPHTVDSLRKHNFSGRWQQLEPTYDLLSDWFSNPPSSPDVQSLQVWAFEHATLSGVINGLEPLYRDPCTAAPSEVFGFGSAAVGELLLEIDSARREAVSENETLRNASGQRE